MKHGRKRDFRTLLFISSGLSSRSHYSPRLEGLCVLGTVRQAPEPPTLLSVARARHRAHAAGKMEQQGERDSAQGEPSVAAGAVNVQGAATPPKGSADTDHLCTLPLTTQAPKENTRNISTCDLESHKLAHVGS